MACKPNGPSCVGCVLQPLGSGFARTDGLGINGVLVVAEALGESEAEEGLPLVGKTGKLFNRMVERTTDPQSGQKLQRSDFLLANVINCRPPENLLSGEWYEEAAIARCSVYLKETIDRFKPKAILAMGNTPLAWLTGHQGIEQWRGYVVETEYGPVVPTYHPSYLQRGKMALVKVWIHDMLKALHISRNGSSRSHVSYSLRPSPEEAYRWLQGYKETLEREPNTPLAFDIETPYSGNLDEDQAAEEDASYVVERIGFSYKENTAITFPWMPPFTSIARSALSTEGPKLVWNEAYDVPRLDYNDSPVQGRIYDSMWAYHTLHPEWPYGLKYAATFYTDLPQWKHQSRAQPEWYNAVDNDALIRVHNKVRVGLEKAGQWETYERHVVDLGMVLRKMARRGVLVDPAKRKEARERFQLRYEECVEKLNLIVPPSTRTTHPKGGYKKPEEKLRKANLWQEGRMVVVGVIDVVEKPIKEKKPRVKKEGVVTPSTSQKKSRKQTEPTVDAKIVSGTSGIEKSIAPQTPSSLLIEATKGSSAPALLTILPSPGKTS